MKHNLENLPKWAQKMIADLKKKYNDLMLEYGETVVKLVIIAKQRDTLYDACDVWEYLLNNIDSMQKVMDSYQMEDMHEWEPNDQKAFIYAITEREILDITGE